MVNFFVREKTRRPAPAEVHGQAASRARRLDSAALAEWVHVLLSEAGRNISQWERGRDDQGLEEFRLSVQALHAIAEEMARRQT
jgi:hypothetical protein